MKKEKKWKKLALKKLLLKLFLKLKRWILRNINHLLIKPHKDWETLPAKQFFKVLEENDLRHILKRYVVNYDQSLLMDTYEIIMYQYEEGINDKNYTHHMRLINENYKKENEINGLIICFELYKIDPEAAIEELKYWGINLKNGLSGLKNIILGKKTTLNINAIRDKKDENKPIIFEETLVNFESILNKDFIPRNITLKDWCSYYKLSRIKIKQNKKYGRRA